MKLSFTNLCYADQSELCMKRVWWMWVAFPLIVKFKSPPVNASEYDRPKFDSPFHYETTDIRPTWALVVCFLTDTFKRLKIVILRDFLYHNDCHCCNREKNTGAGRGRSAGHHSRPPHANSLLHFTTHDYAFWLAERSANEMAHPGSRTLSSLHQPHDMLLRNTSPGLEHLEVRAATGSRNSPYTTSYDFLEGWFTDTSHRYW